MKACAAALAFLLLAGGFLALARPGLMPSVPPRAPPAPVWRPEGSVDAVFQAGLAFGRTGEAAKAIEALEHVTSRHPDDPRFPRAVEALARQYRSLGLADRALALFAVAGLDLSQGAPSGVLLARHEEGLCEAAAGNPGRAVAILEELMGRADLAPESEVWRKSRAALASLRMEAGAAMPEADPVRAARRGEIRAWLEASEQEGME